jgi:phosphotransferase system enzyme I (PtsP)
MTETPRQQGSGSWAGSRRLLTRLREVMASPDTTQVKLNSVVQLIAQDMVAEVCSLYIRKAGDVLELSATQGLRQEAVHQTRLYVGEGLVGDIASHARPLALAEAQAHPNFAFKPETGEEIYHSLLGVPILRDGRVLGVLVIQNRTARQYTEEEIEVLETVAMVLAELAASARLVALAEVNHNGQVASSRLDGVKINGGVAIGKALLHIRAVAPRTIIADNEEAEIDRLTVAAADMLASIDAMLSGKLAGSDEYVEVLETYQIFAQDAGWIRRIREAIHTGLTAEAAVQRVLNEMRARMRQSTDAYLRERLQDLEDLTHRLMQHLQGERGQIPDEDTILIARSLGPMELLDYQPYRLKGVVLEEGAATAHVSIIARAMGIPMLGSAQGILQSVQAGDTVVLDANGGQVYARPNLEILERFNANIKLFSERQQRYIAEKDLAFQTKDGVTIEVKINAGLVADVEYLHTVGADGVGLYRTEIPFMIRDNFPDSLTQEEIYRKVLNAAKGKSVVFRTLDVGSDKTLSAMDTLPKEENPAMGWRAIRMSLDRPSLLRQQLRALLKAAADKELRVMFPMVSDVSEFIRAKQILLLERDSLNAAGHKVAATLKVGSMLEVPSLLWQLPTLFKHVDFISVGSNDLLQFLFASDRSSPLLNNRYEALSPPFLTMLASLAQQCDAAKIPLTVCGEIAGSPLEALALIGLGFRSLSMTPHAVGAMRTMIRSMEAKSVGEYVQTLLHAPHPSVRIQLKNYARDRGIGV